MSDEQRSFIEQFHRDVEAWQQDHRPARLYVGDQLTQLKEYVRIHSVSGAEWTFTELAIRREVFDDIANQASTEIRTPLTAILGITAVLLKGVPGPLNDQQSKQIESIHRQGSPLWEVLTKISALIEDESMIKWQGWWSENE
jgi:signal transduction histidine kinase